MLIKNVFIVIFDVFFNFRQSVWTCLKRKVIPVLGALISYMDTHNNLEILNRGDSMCWQNTLWIGMLANTDITVLRYADIGKPMICSTQLEAL